MIEIILKMELTKCTSEALIFGASKIFSGACVTGANCFGFDK